MKIGDLVRIKKGYKLKPSPQTGDVGLIIDNLDDDMFIVLIPGKFIKEWRVERRNIEVLSEVSKG